MITLLDAIDIQSIIPHRYPFQLIDKVIAYKQGENIIALKAVSINEPFFVGHFPDFAIMPGVLIIEALAQTTSVLLELTNRSWAVGDEIIKKESNLVGVLGSVKINIVRAVHPGSMLYLHAKVDWQKDSTSSLKVEAYSNDDLCAQGSMIVAIKDKQLLMGKKALSIN